MVFNTHPQAEEHVESERLPSWPCWILISLITSMRSIRRRQMKAASPVESSGRPKNHRVKDLLIAARNKRTRRICERRSRVANEAIDFVLQ